jgi:hypothetical protein
MEALQNMRRTTIKSMKQSRRWHGIHMSSQRQSDATVAYQLPPINYLHDHASPHDEICSECSNVFRSEALSTNHDSLLAKRANTAPRRQRTTTSVRVPWLPDSLRHILAPTLVTPLE